MAAPQLSEALIKNPTKLILSFDQPLDDTVVFPATCFSINYGRVPINAVEYYGTAQIVITLDQTILPKDKLQLNYQPPDDISQALRGTVPDNPTSTQIRRNAVRAFYKVPVKNMLVPDETAWMANSNLGGGKRFIPGGNGLDPEFDISIPGYDICGDGSVIIGNPNNIVNTEPNGAILTLVNLVGGAGYTDGIWADVPAGGGFGSKATLGLTVENGVVTEVNVGDAGKEYRVGDLLIIDGADFGGGGAGFSVEVETVYDAYAAAVEAGLIPAGASPAPAVAGGIQEMPYPIPDRGTPRSATPDDFILAYGLKEAIQISNLDNADAIEPNTEKIWMAIEDACSLIDNYIASATRAGKVLISSNRRRTSLIIARYYLDTVRRREDVKSDYEQAITELDRSRSLSNVSRPDLPWWADPCSTLRGKGVVSHRIPQVYNGVTGKGLSGWWNDSGHSEVDDWRYDRNNAEGNNDYGNRSRSVAPDRTLDQPVDDGGSNDGGDTP